MNPCASCASHTCQPFPENRQTTALSQLRCSLYCSYPSHIFLKVQSSATSPSILSDLLSAPCPPPHSELATSTVALFGIKKEGRKEGRSEKHTEALTLFFLKLVFYLQVPDNIRILCRNISLLLRVRFQIKQQGRLVALPDENHLNAAGQRSIGCLTS
jgi:hypothetical protein